MPLTDAAARNAKPSPKAIKLSDGKGLYLLIQPTGSKLWRLKYRFGNKEKKLSLGAYPEVSLSHARDRVFDARRLLTNGVDPGQHKKQTCVQLKLLPPIAFKPSQTSG